MQVVAYGNFYDYPRHIFVNYKNNIFFLECDFNEEKDDYDDYYMVYSFPESTPEDFYTGYLYRKPYTQIEIGKINISDLQSNTSFRKSVFSKRLEEIFNSFLDAPQTWELCSEGIKVMQIVGYGNFYDVPRGMFVRYKAYVFFLHCVFNDEKDDYEDYYTVYALPEIIPEDFYTGSFYSKSYTKIDIGKINISDLDFDLLRRKSVSSKTLEETFNSYVDNLSYK